MNMQIKAMKQDGSQVILHTSGVLCSTREELVAGEFFAKIVNQYIEELLLRDSPLLGALGQDLTTLPGRSRIVTVLKGLVVRPLEEVVQSQPGLEGFLACRQALHEFNEGLYNFWRSFDRYLVCHSEQGTDSHDLRPYRTFTNTVEHLTHLVRSVYRDIAENITGDHPRVYRQVAAGCKVGLIVMEREWRHPAESCRKLDGIPFIRQVWIDPPLIIDPPMNKRTGQFQRVAANPLDGLLLDKSRWLCYPARVGSLVIFVYFHTHHISLGCSLANLFELAADEQIAKGPDAIYLYGVPDEFMSKFGPLPTVFHDDEARGLLVGAVPLNDKFGYFGYLKKMVLTLHNIVMMKRGRMPYHGAMTRIALRNEAAANVLLIGDTGAGKSELLEAFRTLGKDHIRQMRIVADDMGSLEVAADGSVLGYGTEIGAFVRLDDLQKGYAFAQIDRAIIMSPHKVNARVVVPVTTMAEVTEGYPVEFMLYANNYEQVDDHHPIIEPFARVEDALRVFREGAAMAKGTTTATGLVHSYFANVFGPAQYPELHEALAARTFEAAVKAGVFLGQIRTRLGIPGYETKGPEEAAQAFFDLISGKKAP